MNAISKSTVGARADRQNIYTRVTAKVIADLEKGVRTWQRPWSIGRAASCVQLPLRHCGTPYRGINVLLLWLEAVERGYAGVKWMTYRQAGELGGQVRKGEHGSTVALR